MDLYECQWCVCSPMILSLAFPDSGVIDFFLSPPGGGGRG